MPGKPYHLSNMPILAIASHMLVSGVTKYVQVLRLRWQLLTIDCRCRIPIKAVQWRLNDTSAWQDVQHTAARWIIDSPDEVC